MHWIDPACLPETRGKATCFLLNPHGELDGLVLDHQTQVHFPPHLARQVTRHIKLNETVRVRGIQPRAAAMIAAVQLVAAGGAVILDEGPDPHRHEHDLHEHRTPDPDRVATDTSGSVVMSLFGPKGELRGALLDNGTSLRMPPHAAQALASYLTPGACVQAWGRGVRNRYGAVVDVEEIAELIDAET